MFDWFSFINKLEYRQSKAVFLFPLTDNIIYSKIEE